MPYSLRGRFLEACDCSVPCPCWFEQKPDEDECSGLIAWQIEQGDINGFDVSGRTVVSLSQHDGHRNRPEHLTASLVVDEGADEAQLIVLSEAFSGKLGGPLAELAGLWVEREGLVERAPVSFATDGRTTRLRVGPRVEIETRLLLGANDRPITIGDGILASLLGDPGEAGKAERFHLDLPGRPPIATTERSTTSGRFRYRHEA